MVGTKALRHFLVLHWAVLLVLTIIIIDFSQALLLEQMNDSTSTLGKILNIYIVGKVRLRLFGLRLHSSLCDPYTQKVSNVWVKSPIQVLSPRSCLRPDSTSENAHQ